MSRAPDLKLLSPRDLLEAAERILAYPACNTQRASLNEVYTFAVAATQLAEVAAIVSRQIAGRALPEDDRALRGHMVALGCLPVTFLTDIQEPPHVG